MPWCPKCKNEYKAGVKVCADCGCELVENEKESQIPVIFGTEEEMNTLREYLTYSKIDDASVKPDEDGEGFVLYINADKEIQAKKLIALFLHQKEMERLATGSDEQEDEETEEIVLGVYQDSAQKAEDNRSSGLTLLGVGTIGIAVMILGMTGILPIRLNPTTSYMVYGVMSALFILFIVMGVVSMRNSKIFAKKAESENSLKSTIEQWCLESLKAEDLDQEAFGAEADTLSEEMKYFKRIELIKKKISAQFMNLDVQFLEHFTDEIYGDIFEKE